MNGAVGAVWIQGGQTRVAFNFTTTGEKIAEIEIVADPVRLGQLEVLILD